MSIKVAEEWCCAPGEPPLYSMDKLFTHPFLSEGVFPVPNREYTFNLSSQHIWVCSQHRWVSHTQLSRFSQTHMRAAAQVNFTFLPSIYSTNFPTILCMSLNNFPQPFNHFERRDETWIVWFK